MTPSAARMTPSAALTPSAAQSADRFQIQVNMEEIGHGVAEGDGEKMRFSPLPSAQDVYYSNNPDGKTYSTEQNTDEANIIHESRHIEDHQKGIATTPKGSEAHEAAEGRAMGDGNIWRAANNMRPRDSYDKPTDRVPEEKVEKEKE